jgi:rifampicin phosphotransferase
MSTLGEDSMAAEDVNGFWMWDNVHAPRPMAPISGDTVTQHLAKGFTRAMKEFGGPAVMESRQFNYYPYHSMSVVPPEGETEEQRTARYQDTMTNIVPRVGELWEKEWLPFILSPLEEARRLDYGALDDAGLWSTLLKQVDDSADRWWIHGKLNYVLVAASQFADYYNKTLQPETPVEAYEVLQGFDTLSLEQGRGLWRLSRIVKNNSGLTRTFTEVDVARLVEELNKSADGRSFLQSLGEYLEEFGWRSDAIYDIAATPWREDPTIPLGTIKGFVTMGDERDPDREHERSIARRQELLDSARERLKGDPVALRKFNDLYEAARHNLAVTENHNYYIDCLGVAVLRLPLLEMGRRLVKRGLLEKESDVFMLHLAELEEVLLRGADLRDTVARRLREIEEAAATIPPATMGTPQPIDMNDPFAEAMLGKMIGLGGMMEPTGQPNVLTGVPASTGIVTGKAKVVRSLTEASKLQPGDIMVCEMTTPPWTPLFATISALVADTGGVLSHCAIVAREYRLPAVVGTQVGTTTITDGMTITVDGSQGLVRIESMPDGGAFVVDGDGEADAPALGVDGKWNLAWDTPMGHIDAVLEVETSGAKLTGTLFAQDVLQEVRDGKVKADQLSFKATAQTPMGKLNLTFEGRVESNAMSGTIKAMMMKLPFSGTRAAP